EDSHILHPAHLRLALRASPPGLLPESVAPVADVSSPRVLTAARPPFRDSRLADLAGHLTQSKHGYAPPCRSPARPRPTADPGPVADGCRPELIQLHRQLLDSDNRQRISCIASFTIVTVWGVIAMLGLSELETRAQGLVQPLPRRDPPSRRHGLG